MVTLGIYFYSISNFDAKLATSLVGIPNPYKEMDRVQLIDIMFDSPSEFEAAKAIEELTYRDNPEFKGPLFTEDQWQKIRMIDETQIQE